MLFFYHLEIKEAEQQIIQIIVCKLSKNNNYSKMNVYCQKICFTFISLFRNY